MCFEIELVGGAVDGRRLPVCGDPMNPPTDIKVADHAPLRLTPDNGQPTVEDALRTFNVLLYVRDAQPRASDSGPHWLYRLQPQPAA